MLKSEFLSQILTTEANVCLPSKLAIFRVTGVCLIRNVPVNIFHSCWDGSYSGLNQYLAEYKGSCSRRQCIASDEVSQLIRFARASGIVADFNTRNKLLTQKLLKQGYRYHKLRKTFSKFYRRYYDLISKFQVGLKSLLRQGLSEPDFYGDLVYKLKKIVGSNNFSAQFIKIISHYKKIDYNINVLQQTACLVVNPITVGNFAFLFNCMPVGRTSDSMMVPT